MAAASSSSPKAKAKPKSSPAKKPRTASTRAKKAPVMSEGVLFWRRALRWLSRGLMVAGGATFVLGLVGFIVGLFVAGPLTALTYDLQTIWFHAHSFSLDLFQVLIERKLFFWLPSPGDAWFNVVRPILWRTPVQLLVGGGVVSGFGWGIWRVLRT